MAFRTRDSDDTALLRAFSPRYPADLPITERREEIVSAIAAHQVVVITGETGSGKSTQIPKLCIEAGRGRSGLIGCTQPRRIAAITLAARVAEETGPDGPRLVGYKIRFQDRTARTTRIKFMTDGILLAEAQKDRLFRAYDTIIVDEAHERSVNIDLLIGILKQTLPKRPDLKVIITSATIDPHKFSEVFDGAPMIEVSGRTWPVEVRYRPPEESEEDEAGDTAYIDQAVEAADLLRNERKRGDILVFMPTESDIRETVQRLEEKNYPNTVVMPLFGRMAASDQQRIFSSVSGDKIVVATNVAETSITIPRIKYVIDTGLARIAHYNPRSKTRSLPIARVSRASADQRKGRCGRVEAGVCIRLYSEEDYLDRPMYTPPEIKRSNLAEVILRMLYLGLGSVEDFPFPDPPSPAAIKDGFGVLKELGAVDDYNRLTRIGRTMARLPLDPRISRMLIEARQENALYELMIIGAALSIQDPRERPLGLEAQAEQAQAVFRDQRSDFVSLLKIWQACLGDQPGAGAKVESRDRKAPNGENGELGGRRTTGQVRKFCREHFLSFRRVREWQDIFEETRSILGELDGFIENTAPAAYDAIHRSVLSGYLSQVALRKEKNVYTAARGRQAMIFPGSNLFNKGGQWILASELVQTSRLFARTAADIDPSWIEQVGRHVCKYSWSEPHWEKKRGQVVALEKVTVYGLILVEGRKVAFERLNPSVAREIFIRSALVEGDVSGRYDFLEHNRELISLLEQLESKTRRRDILVDEEAIAAFYDARIPQIADIRSFDRLIRESGGDDFLKMKEEDLLRMQPDPDEMARFPDTFDANGTELPLQYAFHPGEEDDGVTLTVPVHTLPVISRGELEWLVPGLLPEKVTLLLKGLPKGIRKRFVPFNETAARIIQALEFGKGDFYGRLSEAVFEVTDVRVTPDQWNTELLPEYLKIRFEVVNPKGNSLAAGRDIDALRPLAVEKHEDGLWREAKKAWERELSGADFPALPASIEIGTDATGFQRLAYPGLAAEESAVVVRLFTDPERAVESTRQGLMRLYKSAFSSELKKFQKDWAFPGPFAAAVFFMGGIKDGSSALYDYILRCLFELQRPCRADPERFRANLKRLEGRLGTLGGEVRTPVLEAVKKRHETASAIARFKRMAGANRAVIDRMQAISAEMERLMPADFLSNVSEERIRQLPRYLKALGIRAERAYNYPEKDRAKEAGVDVYRLMLEGVRKRILSRPSSEGLDFLEEVSRMIEELGISLFAPEIKTLFPISGKRIEEKLQGFSE